MELENLAIAPLVPLLPANKELIGKSGAIHSALSMKFGPDADIFAGDIHISDLVIYEKDQKYPLILWKFADILQLRYKSQKSRQASSNSLSIDELIVDSPILQFEINEEGFSNFRRLFTKPASE